MQKKSEEDNWWTQELAGRIKKRREKILHLSRKEFSERTRITRGKLANIENNNTEPKYDEFMKIADALGIFDIDPFIDKETPGSERTSILLYTKETELKSIKDTADFKYEVPKKKKMKDHLMYVSFVTLNPEKKIENKQHYSEEIIYVIKGGIKCEIDRKPFDLGHGEWIHFKSLMLHNIINKSKSVKAQLLVIRVA